MRRKKDRKVFGSVVLVLIFSASLVWIFSSGCSHPTGATLPTASGLAVAAPVVSSPIPTPHVIYDGEPGGTHYMIGVPQDAWVSPTTCTAVNDASGQHSHNGVGCMALHLTDGYYAGMGWNWAQWNSSSPKIADLTPYTNLELWIKGTTGKEKNIAVQFLDVNQMTNPAPVPYIVNNSARLSTQYTHYVIPLSSFNWSGMDKTKIWEIDIEVEPPAPGFNYAFYVDDIQLSTPGGPSDPYAPVVLY